MAEPKCPKCDIFGIEHITNSRTNDDKYDVIHCSNCGHIYGICAKIVYVQHIPPRSIFQPNDSD